MSADEEKIKRIISLKRYETPPEEYFEDFLQEFQQRRKADAARCSPFQTFLERMTTRFREAGSLKWVAGIGIAYAAVMAALLLWPAHHSSPEDPNLSPASYEPEVKPTPKPDPSAPGVRKF